MEVIHSIFVPLFDYDYSTLFSTVKGRVLKIRELFFNKHFIFCEYAGRGAVHTSSQTTVTVSDTSMSSGSMSRA